MDERLQERVRKHCTIAESGCWIWTGAKRGGYGAIGIGGHVVDAHRVSYLAFCGAIPPGVYVMHSCDVRSCVNPDHLSLGSSKQNNVDAVAKGLRRPFQRRAVLDAVTADAICERFAAGQSQRQLCAAFGIPASSLKRLLVRRGLLTVGGWIDATT